MPVPPFNPDIRRQLKLRLLDLSPRAFELFAGDLLVYVGLHDVAVTRYVGDGGIDARGTIVGASGIIRIPTGIQVKRHRQNVQRSDIDRFIGALSGQYPQGIFITTAGYAAQARAKADRSVTQVTAVDGDQVVRLMLQHQLGLTTNVNESALDQLYFDSFELQAAQRTQLREQPELYTVASPGDDIITLRALSYALRVDPTTIRTWIEQGKLIPDNLTRPNNRHQYFFRRDRVDQIRRDFVRTARPTNGTEWRQEFLDFARSRRLTKSYKPVLFQALLKLVDRSGAVMLDDLAQEFRAFYIRRAQQGLAAEFGVKLLKNPEVATIDAIKQLIVKYPLDRFVIKGFLVYSPATNIVQFAPQLWQELRFYELMDIKASVDEQLRYYYDRHA